MASNARIECARRAFRLAITTLIVSVGRLGDMTGRRRLLLAGIFLFTAASVLCGFAPTLWLLIAARAAQGLGAAVMMALTMAFVSETVPKEKTGSGMGLLGTMSAIGTALGPSLGGVLIAGLGWRAIFLVNVPLGVLAFLFAHRYLPVDRRGPKTDRSGFDKIGTLMLALTLAAYALAMTMGRGRFGSLNMALLLAAALGAGLFVLVEARAASPLIRLATFRASVMGRRVRACLVDGRCHNGASRGRRHRHAVHVRSRGTSDRCRARHRSWKPCSRNTPFAPWRRVMTPAPSQRSEGDQCSAGVPRMLINFTRGGRARPGRPAAAGRRAAGSRHFRRSPGAGRPRP